ncbi:hypothetical protein [Streptomyces sp. NPDC001507]|uniref:hypothetical protein n=1 Tax=Streptomyces sp. NPDC001507 TaxID=3364579 RepID=UPI0036A4C27B
MPDTFHPRIAAHRVPYTEPNGRTTYELVIECPYCDRQHTHGEPYGFRVPHCDTSARTLPEHLKLEDVTGLPQYELCSPADIADEQADRVTAKLLVLRNVRDRLRREVAVEPYSARARRTHAAKVSRLGEITKVLTAAGVAG